MVNLRKYATPACIAAVALLIGMGLILLYLLRAITLWVDFLPFVFILIAGMTVAYIYIVWYFIGK